ncbi:putative enzyme related to lactoylglutathione lyase [Roseimicrobium gellanilyticum]|uniref:Putative enzyme related to lactoylglutathione lyase n=1 Tax=Roseimicrobium gellanilyticum TaxID=748857 RepID=A0A366HPJ9_9BACT|nr:VOC family protein [Roseimicrobium gellanilyticum]RBP45291.1 putative enzyme related to lactoylglutathione lyase [Roseimicrobium gellanilyticum]
MLKVTEFAFTGYPVTDMARSRAFYEGVLNLTPASVFDHDGKSWVEYEVGPHVLALSNMAPDWKPGTEGGGVALEVEDFDAAIKWLKEKNVTFFFDVAESPVCHMALISDPDGNSICIHKRKPGHH